MTDRLASDLAELHIDAPDEFIDSVLVAIGLVDHYVTRPSPLGDVFVAFNGLGVSGVDVAGDAASFEGRFVEIHGRRAVPTDEQHPRRERLALAVREPVHEQLLARVDAVLLAADLDDRVGHREQS